MGFSKERSPTQDLIDFQFAGPTTGPPTPVLRRLPIYTLSNSLCIVEKLIHRLSLGKLQVGKWIIHYVFHIVESVDNGCLQH